MATEPLQVVLPPAVPAVSSLVGDMSSLFLVVASHCNRKRGAEALTTYWRLYESCIYNIDERGKF